MKVRIIWGVKGHVGRCPVCHAPLVYELRGYGKYRKPSKAELRSVQFDEAPAVQESTLYARVREGESDGREDDGSKANNDG